MNYNVGQAARLAQIAAEHKALCLQRRDLVLSVPDVAARLTERPFLLGQASNWSGYIPPDFTDGGHRPNPSPWIGWLNEIVQAAQDALDAGAVPVPVDPPEPPVVLDTPPTQYPYVPPGLRYRDIDDVPLPEPPDEQDEG